MANTQAAVPLTWLQACAIRVMLYTFLQVVGAAASAGDFPPFPLSWFDLLFASHKWTEVLGGFVSKISLSPHNTKRMVSGPSYLLYFSLNLSARTPFFSPFPAYKKRRLAVPAAVVRCLTCCVVPVRLVAHRT